MEHIEILRPNLCPISGQDPQFSNIFKINKLDLLWVQNFIALGIHFNFGIKFSWNEGVDTCFNVECVLILTVILIFLVVTWWLPFATWWSLDVTARYWWLLLVPIFSTNAFISTKTLFWFLRYSYFCNFSPSCPTFLRLTWEVKNGICHKIRHEIIFINCHL